MTGFEKLSVPFLRVCLNSSTSAVKWSRPGRVQDSAAKVKSCSKTTAGTQNLQQNSSRTSTKPDSVSTTWQWFDLQLECPRARHFVFLVMCDSQRMWDVDADGGKQIVTRWNQSASSDYRRDSIQKPLKFFSLSDWQRRDSESLQAHVLLFPPSTDFCVSILEQKSVFRSKLPKLQTKFSGRNFIICKWND